ncbi:MAG TPA: FG-GAP-like repeat-containing protein [Candidatus Binatia bacterium]|jgi:hypothetical protein
MVLAPPSEGKKSHGWLALAGAVALVAAMAGRAAALEVQCGADDGDAFGWSVATGGDYDGDGVPDIAVGAPCAWVGTSEKSGRVKVFSGATGAVLASLPGVQDGERYGAALDFIPDLDGDGRDELAIGAPAFDVPKETSGVRLDAGRLEVRSMTHGVLWETRGANDFAGLGETVSALADLNGDGKADIAVGASEALVDGSRDGVAYVLSGADGSVLGQNDGLNHFENWGSLVGYAGDVDGDGIPDWFASANGVSLPAEDFVARAAGVTTTTASTTTTTSTTTTLVDRAGRLSIISGKPPFDVIVALRGDETRQRFGRSAVATTDGNGDGKSDLWIGSPGAKVGNTLEAGAIDLYTGDGTKIRRIVEPTPQQFAGFGTSLVAPGSLDGGPGSDVVVGAPDAKVQTRVAAGRVEAFNASNGAQLWSQSGSLPNSQFGQSLGSGIDFDADGVPDIIAGSPGATPDGRRGAGAAYVLSGANGSVLASFAGRRGRESRIYVSGPNLDREVVIRSFDPFGHRREAEIRAFRGYPTTKLSMALLDQSDRAGAANSLLAVGAGSGGGSSNVVVYRAQRRRRQVSQFPAFPTVPPGPMVYSGSVNVAGGNFSAANAGDEIAVAPADNVTGTIDIAVHRRQFVDPNGMISWQKIVEFAAFKPADTIEGNLVNAVGVNIAGGNVQKESDPNGQQDEVIAAPAAGLPAVRVFSGTGTQVAQWQAYPLQGSLGPNSGVLLAVADLNGDGQREIITCPASGQIWIQAWDGKGKHFTPNGLGNAVSFFLTGHADAIAAADVDFDGADEILISTGPGSAGQVLAFEADGSPVKGWQGFAPYGPLAQAKLGLVGTNSFWRP